MPLDGDDRNRALAKRLRGAFGAKLAKLRRERTPKVSQTTLGRALGVSRASVSNIEHGRHRVFLDQVYVCALVLGRPLSDFLPTLDELEASAGIHFPAGSGIEGLESQLAQAVLDVISTAEAAADGSDDFGEES